jgi:hypothetical protein
MAMPPLPGDVALNLDLHPSIQRITVEERDRRW